MSPADEERLRRAGQVQLAALHRLGRLLAHVGAEKLDQDAGGLGFITNEVDAYTAATGQMYREAGLVPEVYEEPPVPPPRKWIIGLVLGGMGVGALLALLLAGPSKTTVVVPSAE